MSVGVLPFTYTVTKIRKREEKKREAEKETEKRAQQTREERNWEIKLCRRLSRQRSVFPSDTALLKALYLSTFEATKKWTMPVINWGKVYGELAIMYDGRLPD